MAWMGSGCRTGAALAALALLASMAGCGGGSGSAADAGADARPDASFDAGRADAGDAGPGDAKVSDAGDGGLDGDLPPLPPECGHAAPAFDGALCGPAPTPCNEQVDEQVHGAAFRNDAPSIAIDGSGRPTVLHATAEEGYEGYLARRDASGWSQDPIDSPVVAAGSLAFDADGRALIVTDDGAFDIGLYGREGERWTMLGDLPDGHVAEGSLALDEGGCAHVLHSINDEPEREDVPMMQSTWQDGTWLRNARIGLHIPWSGTGFGAQALGPRDPSPQLVWSDSVDDRYRVRWTDGERSETVWRAPPERSYTAPLPMEMAIADAGGEAGPTPHVLFADEDRTEGTLHAAARIAGGWEIRTVARWVLTGCDPLESPSGPDDTCSYEQTRAWPLAVVTSGNGDVRYVFVREVETADLTAECTMPPGGPEMCSWSGPTDVDATLEVAWPDGDGIATAVLADDVQPVDGSAALDGDGEMHVALYDRSSPDSGDAAVRYLRFGAP